MQMVLTPNDLFSWNNKYSKYTSYYCDYIHKYNSLSIFQLCTSLTLCMLAFWSREGVVLLVHSSSSLLTAGHVFSLPLSGANWRSLSLLWGSGPPLPKMAPPSTGTAHTPFLGSNTNILRYAKPRASYYYHFQTILILGSFLCNNQVIVSTYMFKKNSF